MATLTTALQHATAGLSTATANSAIISRNIVNAQTPDYSHKRVELTTLSNGSPTVASYDRSADKRLLDKLLKSVSAAETKQTRLNALESLSSLTGDPDDEQSISSAIGKLRDALRIYEGNPSSSALAEASISQARNVSDRLSELSRGVRDLRQKSDDDIQASVLRVTSLLGQFKVVNDAVVRGSGRGEELMEALDQRDGILKQLSEELGIRTVTRSNNDIAIYTDSGVALFETVPRSVSFTPSAALQPGQSGQAVLIDGVQVTGNSSNMALQGGRLKALTEVRDQLALQYEASLDETARGLITIFGERDPSANPTLPTRSGLFADGQSPGALPGSPASAGLAARIMVDPAADPSRGGNAFLLRDAGFGGAGYVKNATAAPAYQETITDLLNSLSSPFAFQDSSGQTRPQTATAYAADTVGWIEEQRKSAEQSASADKAVAARTKDALGRVTGVNVDDELAALLALEKSYQASAKIVAIVDSMFGELLQAVG